MCGSQIEPIVRIVRVQCDRSPKILDGSLRVTGNKCEIAPQTIAVIRISRGETHRAL